MIKISNFELQKSYVPQKKAENVYKTDSARKNMIFIKKGIFSIFSIFHDMLEDPLKFWTFNFLKISKKNSKNGLLGINQICKGTKSRILVNLALSLWKQQTDSW